MTPYQYLEQVAAAVMSLVPNHESIVLVEVNFEPHPFTLQFVSTLYCPGELYDSSQSTRLTLEPALEEHIRRLIALFYDHVQTQDNRLQWLTLSVGRDGTFSFGTTSQRQLSE